MSVHAPSFKAGLQAAADFLRSCGFSNIAPDVVRLKPPRASEKKRAAKKSRAKATRSARETKNAETADLRARAMERANGFCECGCGVRFIEGNFVQAPEMDHARGRGKARQSLSNVWMLTKVCHRLKHGASDPRSWLRAFEKHAERYGYAAELAWVQDQLATQDAKAGLPFSVEREP